MPRLRPVKEQIVNDEPEVIENASDEALFDSRPPEIEKIVERVIEKKADRRIEKVEPEDKGPDISALQKQIKELEKSEKEARDQSAADRRDREAAIKLANDRERDAVELQKGMVDTRFDAVTAGIAAATAEAESAQRDIEAAITIGDTKAQADAYRRLARAESNLARYEDGKIELEEAKKNPPKPREIQTEADGLDKTNLPETAKTWLRAHPDYLSNPRKNAKIQSLHWDVVEEGHEAFSKPYFDSLEIKLGMKAAPEIEEDDEDEEVEERPVRKGPSVSAPVSREAPGNKEPTRASEVRLTAKEVEAAKMAGITDAEYARQKLAMIKAKKEGHYGGQQ